MRDCCSTIDVKFIASLVLLLYRYWAIAGAYLSLISTSNEEKIRKYPKLSSHINHYIIRKQNMVLLPLHQLLQVPVDALSLVVDNAIRPAQPLSASLKLNHCRRLPGRSISWDSTHSGPNRWSGAGNVENMVPKKPGERREDLSASGATIERIKSIRRTGARNAPARSYSMDSTFETLARGHRPARRPRRKLSPESRQQGGTQPVINDGPLDGKMEPSYTFSTMLKNKLTRGSSNALTPKRSVSPPPLFLSAHDKISTSRMLTDVLEEFEQDWFECTMLQSSTLKQQLVNYTHVFLHNHLPIQHYQSS